MSGTYFLCLYMSFFLYSPALSMVMYRVINFVPLCHAVTLLQCYPNTIVQLSQDNLVFMHAVLFYIAVQTASEPG